MTGIFFGSTTGTTESVAARIAERLGVAQADVHNVAAASVEDVKKYDLLLLGSSTWGSGETGSRLYATRPAKAGMIDQAPGLFCKQFIEG